MVENIDSLRYQEEIKQGKVLIVLGSAWCKDCVKIEPFLKEFQEEYQGVFKIFKIDTRQEEELSATLGLRAIPTLIFYVDGQEVGVRLVEPQTKALIAEEIKKNFL